MKAKLFVGFMIGLSLLAWLPRAEFNAKFEFLKPRFFHTNAFTIYGLGIHANALDHSLASNFKLSSELENVGYALKQHFVQIPNWIALKVVNSQKQLITREESPSAFWGKNSAAIYQESEATAFHVINDFTEKTSIKPVVLMVPTKVFANEIPLDVEDVEPSVRDQFGIDESSRHVLDAENQVQSEERFRAKTAVLSLVELYRTQRAKLKPLYPFAESHWRPELILAVSHELLIQLVEKERIPGRCLSEAKLGTGIEVRYLGDLGVAIGLDESSPYSDAYKTSLRREVLDGQAPPEKVDGCPKIYFAGTSYGDFLRGKDDIGLSLRAGYRGAVENVSIQGQGPLAALKALEKRSLDPSDLVIWEFPFRNLTCLNERKGAPTCEH